MDIVLAYVLFAVGLVLLIKGGDWFVDGATALARRFHLPEILIGATVVSIGTTLPEVMVSATAAVEGQSATAYGNAIGSVICNTALIAALTIAIRPSNADGKTLRLPVAFFFGAAAFYAVVAYFFGTFSRIVGILLLAIFVVYMILTVRSAVKHPELAENEEEAENAPLSKSILLLVIGAALIAVGARLLVDKGTVIADSLGVPDTVIALTFVALGTSLPELITAITALMKGHSALSLGNIIGANLFNLVLVSGMAITIRPFDLPEGQELFGQKMSLVIDLPLMFAVMAILTLPAILKNKLSRWQGILLLCLYAGFCALQFAL